MEIERLDKSAFLDPMRGEPTVRFTKAGVVLFNKCAVKHLGLFDKKNGYASVCFGHDTKYKHDLSVFKDSEGWQLRSNKGTAGGAIFNNVAFARHVIDVTWERCSVHPVGVSKPGSVVFRIARLPVDDEKNKDVFALLRKKE
jgi:hypothetical protein